MERAHRKQFVISSQPIRVYEDWLDLPLNDSQTLSYCPDLRAERAPDRDGTLWTIIGHAFTFDPEAPDPIQWLRQTHTSSVAKMTWGWTGRWILLGNDTAIPDASALLGLFYGRDASGATIASSSLALLRHQFFRGEPCGERRLVWDGMNWFPLPGSRLAPVRKLLPSQILDLSTATPYRSPRQILSTRFEKASLNERADVALAGLGRTLKAAASSNAIYLCLTAGGDSRTAFSAAIHCGVPFKALTFVHHRMSKADRVIPAEICHRYRMPHVQVQPGAPLSARRALFDHHTGGDSVDVDKERFAGGAFETLQPGWLVRSGCWEIARHFYSGRPRLKDFTALASDPIDLVRSFGHYYVGHREAEALLEWATWRLGEPEDGMDPVDVFYWEQRLAGWLAGVEQAHDLLHVTSLQPANSSMLFDILLKGSQPCRGRAELQKAIIQRGAPGLKDVPINPPLDPWRKFAERVRTRLRLIKGDVLSAFTVPTR